MTVHESRTIRFLVIAALTAATAGITVVSMRANYLFGYGFGQSPEKAQVFGWANVAADLWKVAGLVVITTLWRGEQKRFAIVLAPLWLLCLVWGLTGAIGVYAQDRTALVAGRQARSATYGDETRELSEIERKLSALSMRSVAQLDAAIAAVLARPVTMNDRVRGTVGKLSDSCSKEQRFTAESCLEVAQLRAERTESAERARLEERKQILQINIEKLRESGGTLAADPVAELFAWLSRGQLSVRDIAFGFPLMFAILIEVVSAFGPAGIAAYAQVTRQAPAGESRLEPAAAGWSRQERAALPQSNVVAWIAERGVPTSDARGIGCDELYEDYRRWCRTENAVALDAGAFTGEFDRVRELPELRGKIRKFGNRYFGIKLLADNVAMLATQR